jgi:hypothetical protein
MLLVLAVMAALQPAEVPLPRPRPAIPAGPTVATETPHGPPTDCDRRLAEMAQFELKPGIEGPGACGGQDLVALSAIRLPDGKRAAVQPPAVLRCEMAESFAGWIRDEVVPRLASAGEGLAAVRQDDSYFCRNRVGATTNKLSEHAHGNAIDIESFVLADRHAIALTDVNEPKDLRSDLRDSACRRFTTVLGPGEPAHDSHIHLDILERRAGYRICSWDVREPAPAVAKSGTAPALTDSTVGPVAKKAEPSTTGSAVALAPVAKRTEPSVTRVAVPLPPPRPGEMAAARRAR